MKYGAAQCNEFVLETFAAFWSDIRFSLFSARKVLYPSLQEDFQLSQPQSLHITSLMKGHLETGVASAVLHWLGVIVMHAVSLSPF